MSNFSWVKQEEKSGNFCLNDSQTVSWEVAKADVGLHKIDSINWNNIDYSGLIDKYNYRGRASS